MIWVVIVCQYLESVFNPERDLEELLGKMLSYGRGAEKQMDELYATILQKWDWKDTSFSETYDSTMGTTASGKNILIYNSV